MYADWEYEGSKLFSADVVVPSKAQWRLKVLQSMSMTKLCQLFRLLLSLFSKVKVGL